MVLKRRDDVIDMMKGLAIILVIYGHSHFIPLIGEWIYTFHMPLFFFLSGCLYKSEYNLRKNLKRIILPYISFAIIICIVTLLLSCFIAVINHLDVLKILSAKICELKLNFLNAINGDEKSFFFKTIWFLPVLFVVEYLYFILQKIFTDGAHLICFLFLLISVFLFYKNINIPYFIDTILLVVPYYHCGRVFYNNRFIFSKLSNISIFLMIIIPIIVVLLMNYKVDYKYNIVPWYNHILSLMTIVGFYLLFNKFKTKNKFIISLGKMSIFYFGLHRSLFLIYLPFFSKLNINIYVQSILLCMITVLSIYLFLHLLGKKSNWILLNFD